MKKYYVRKHYSIPLSKVQIYGDFLEKLSDKSGGRISPEVVLNAAIPKNSPIHDFFEWDDNIAARQWRLQQSRYLIRSIEVEIIRKGKSIIERKFFNVNDIEDGRERLYIDVDVMEGNPEFRKQIIEMALREIKYWTEKYKNYKELNEIFKAIDDVEKKLK